MEEPSVTASAAAIMYLPMDQWSPRFDKTFFSVSIESAQEHERPLVLREGIGGKLNSPAVYYDVAVYCEHRKTILQRRYSNFYWLFEHIKNFRPPHVEGDVPHEPLQMPPGTCFWQPQNEEFVKNRRHQLSKFVDALLSRPYYAEHPSVRLFFDLDVLMEQDAET